MDYEPGRDWRRVMAAEAETARARTAKKRIVVGCERGVGRRDWKGLR